MLKKLLSITGLIVAILLLSFACWALGFYYNWNEGAWIWLTLSIIVVIFLSIVIFRYWKKWRIRKKMAETVAMPVQNDDSLTKDWYAGINTLKKSRLSRIASPLYALPWFLLIGQDSNKSGNLLKELSTGDPITHDKMENASLRWWPLKTCVVIEPLDRQNVSGNSTFWSRLLKLMFRTRRREPLNGIVISLDVAFLQDSDSEKLKQYGMELRQNIDKINELYGVRVPIYILVTGLEQLSGFSQWQQHLPEAFMQQPMGYSLQNGELEIDDFIHTALDNIKTRLLNLRLLQRGENQTRIEVINIPNHLAALEIPLKQVFVSAFSVNPYAETPLLNSLFFAFNADDHNSSDLSQQSFFSHELFRDVIPKRRFAWQQVRFTKRWKRLLRHALVLLWFIACIIAGVILYSSADMAEKQLGSLTVNGGHYNNVLDNDANVLFKFKTNIEHFDHQRETSTRWLPFQHILTETEEQLRKQLNTDFSSQIMEKNINPLFDKSLPLAHHLNQPVLLAAWTEFLVRRINLSTDALSNKNIDNNPSFANTLAPIFSRANLPSPNALTSEEINDLYKSSVTWLSETRPELLLAQKKQLVEILDDLKTDDHSSVWLNRWIEMQGYISSVQMNNYWKIKESDLPTKISPAYTRGGLAAIKAFLIELNKADSSPVKNGQTFAIYRERFLNLGMQQWQIFLKDFVLGKQFLPDLQSRREIIYDITTNKDPYTNIINELSQLGQEIDKSSRPQWLKNLLIINNTVKASRLSQKDNVISNEANQIGQKILGKLSTNSSVLNKKLTDISQTESLSNLFSEYQDNLHKMVAPLLEGSGNAMKATRDIWAYGHNPDIKTVPFFDALKNINDIQEKISPSTAGENTHTMLWDVVRGPLDFTLDYSARLAACEIQKEWQENIVNSVEYIQSKRQINQILFEKNGQLEQFLKGNISDFIELNGNIYTPRVVYGQSLPFNSQFYAFLNNYQFNKAKLINQKDESSQQQNQIEQLKSENTTLEKEATKLEKIQASITLKTEPVQINTGAKILPQVVTLKLQCASQSYVLENLNFTNAELFQWSSDGCADTSLSIRFSNGLILTKTWAGARGFIDFLNEFSAGQHTYSKADFPASEKQLDDNNISIIKLTYLQTGQKKLLDALKTQDEVQQKIKTNNENIQYIKDLQSGKIENQNPEPIFLPKKIIRYCMEPEVNSTDVANATDFVDLPKPKPIIKTQEEKPKLGYKIRIGVFKNSARLLEKLETKGILATVKHVKLHNQNYDVVTTKKSYASLEQAKKEKEIIDRVLQLKNKSAILKYNNSQKD